MTFSVASVVAGVWSRLFGDRMAFLVALVPASLAVLMGYRKVSASAETVRFVAEK